MGGFRLVTVLGAAPEVAFDRSLDVGFHLRSMAGSREEVVGRAPEGLLGLGDEVTWRARHLGLWWQMTNRVTEYERPHRFVDAQVRGPFQSFRHVHLFQPTPGGCVMTDLVSFTAPYGPVGSLADRVILTRYLQRIIRYRNATLLAELGSPEGA